MTDLEKTIKDFEYQVMKSHGEGWDYVDVTTEDGFNILKLLKNQEPKLVLSERKSETLPFRYERKGYCPTCHQVISWTLNRSFCGFCGQEVKWND